MQNDVISPQNDRPSRKAHRLEKTNCPHWDSPSHTCQLIEVGLFLPVEQHVVSFCLSSHYPSCRHYQLLATLDNTSGRVDTPPVNRRRSIRIPSHHVFRFSEITGRDHLPGVREDDAWTIDLSEHGIRFATRQVLTADTALRFSLDVDETATKIEGIGRVIWSVPLANTPLFHAGIVFTERFVSSLPPRYP
jgi:hypothetical protein